MGKHLSWSSLSLFWACPEAWRLQYLVPDRPRTSNTALVTGSVIHAVIEEHAHKQLRSDNDTVLLPVKDLVRKHLVREWPLVQLTREEKMLPAEVVFDNVAKTCERGASLYVSDILPELRLAGVEAEFSVTHPTWNGWSVNGFIDLVEERNDGGCVRDIKTSKRAPDTTVADTSDQLTIYALAYFAETGRLPAAVQLDYIILSARTHVLPPRVSLRTKADLLQMVNRIAVTTRAIEALLAKHSDEAPVFSPALRGSFGRCKPATCQFYDVCPMGGGAASSEEYDLSALRSLPVEPSGDSRA